MSEDTSNLPTLKAIGRARVTDHALVRYLERVRGLDVEALRQEILTRRTMAAMEFVGTGRVPIDRGGVAVVDNMTIITVTR